MTTRADLPRVSAAIRLAGELLEVHGDLMLSLTDAWAQGAKAANLDPDSRGNRWELLDDGTVVPMPSDPTGEAVLAARIDTRAELHKRLERMAEDAYWIRDMAHVLAPVALPSQVNAKGDIWCTHHLQVGICEPRKGKTDRNTLCRWCSDFWALWNALPPLSLVRARAEKRTITQAMVKDALEKDGIRLEEVKGVTKAIRQARPGGTGKPNQNQKRKREGAA